MSSRNRLILTIALVVVVAIVLVALLVYPQFGKLSDLDKQIAAAQAQIDTAKMLLVQRQAIKAQAAETDAALLRLSNELPENPEIPSLIIELQDTASEAGVDFRTLSPTEPEQRTGYAAIKLSVDVIGEWADVIDYMQRLNKLTRQVRIVGFSATPVAPPPDATATTQKVQASFQLEVYTMAQTAPAPSGTAPVQPAQ
jgi:type IV pilus assembly protein PilO